MEHTVTLSSVLRAERKARNLTQEALAAEVGISRSHVAMIETGGDLPGRDTLVALLTYLGLPLDLIAGASAGGITLSAKAENEEEALWLHAVRKMEEPDRAALLQYVLTRVRPAGN